MPPRTGLFIFRVAVLQIFRAYGAFHPYFICGQSVAEIIISNSLIHRTASCAMIKRFQGWICRFSSFLAAFVGFIARKDG